MRQAQLGEFHLSNLVQETRPYLFKSRAQMRDKHICAVGFQF